MAGTEAIVVPILIDPKAGVAGLKAIGNAAVETASKFGAANTGSKLFGDGVKNLGKSFLSFNPLVGIGITAVSGFIAAITKAAFSTQDLSEAQKKYNGLVNDAIASTAKEVAKIDQLVQFIRLETTTKNQRNNAIKELQKIAPEYFSVLDREKSSIEQVTKAYDSYIGSIRRSVEAKVIDNQLTEVIEKRLKLERQLGVGARNVNTVVKNGKVEVQSYNAIYIEKQELVKLTEELNAVKQKEYDLSLKLAQLRPPKEAFNEIKVPDIKPDKIKIQKPRDYSFANDFNFQEAFDKAILKRIKIPEIKYKLIPDNSAPGTEALDDGFEEYMRNLAAIEASNIRIASQVSSYLTPAIDGFIDALTSRGDAIKSFFQGISNAIKQVIKQLIAAIAQAAILSLLSGGAAAGGLSFKGAFKKVLGFASGGLVTGPVSALVGEGVGTNRSNPEVVSPLNRLKSFFNDIVMSRGGMMNSSSMGTAGAVVGMPASVELRASGRSLVGVISLENQSQRRTG